MTKLFTASAASALLLASHLLAAPDPQIHRLNNLVAVLLDAAPEASAGSVSFVRPTDGWIFISLATRGEGTVRLTLDKGSPQEAPLVSAPGNPGEAMRHVSKGPHTLAIERSGGVSLERLTVKAIPELIHCGLGFDPQIKAYGPYNLEFLKHDVLPNITTTIVPASFKPSSALIDDWHRQGKRLIAEVGVSAQARTAGEHAAYWSGFFGQLPFIDGVIIDEFIVNRPLVEWAPRMTPERLARLDKERADYEQYSEALKKIHADSRFAGKLICVYVGGSGKKLNQEVIGTNVIRTILNCGYFVSPERYLHEMSSERGSRDALAAFLDGLADWEAKEPGVKKQMIITFGLFSMPSGGLNKQPNVDYHVWMDQQMHLVANDPSLANIAGLNWWTSVLADEETVRFVGKLYRHYAIEGHTNMLTRDPLFLTHIQNADFEHGTNGWALHAAEDGAITTKSFPRYGRIEGRFMGLGRPADPEHIGDTFLCMKRSEKGPNSFSQTIKDLEPGRLYSLKMFVCDYDDLVSPKSRKVEEARTFSTIRIDGAELDTARSFAEVYASSPEPKIPVCVTYHWKVFRAQGTTATLTVSDWESPAQPSLPFGQTQAFNFLEIEPYHQ